MNKLFKPIVLGAAFAVFMTLADTPNSPYHVTFVQAASAVVVRAAPIARTAVVVGTTTAVAASSANAAAAANANANANANAAAANANAAAAAANQSHAPADNPPVGTIVTSLPPGCSATNLNGIDYQRCGSIYYTAKMMGNNLVFVVVQP